jgi:mRNA (guanine-N7-)-methyltransferase
MSDAYSGAVKRARVETRDASVDFGVRAYSNCVKAVLVERHVPRGASRLLDLCCGRGGDLDKFQRQQVQEVVGVDASQAQIEEARQRVARMGGSMRVELHHQDAAAFSASPHYAYADAVSCQFALHYFASTDDRLQSLLRVVSAALRPGGCFFGVTTDAHAMRSAAARAVVRGHAGWADALHRVDLSPQLVAHIEAATPGLACGLGYRFNLASGLVDASEEFLVDLHSPAFQQAGLKLQYATNLHDFAADAHFARLAASFRVPAPLPVLDWGVLNLYTAFCFIKA